MAYPDTAAAKTYLGISASTDDTLIGRLVNAAISFVERETGRVFVAASATKKFPCTATFVSKDKLTLALYRDLVSVTTVTNGDGQVVVADTDFYLHPIEAPYHRLVMLPTVGKVWNDGAAGGRISILGTWGYAADVPAALYEAILEIVAIYYRASAAGGTITQVNQAGVFIQGQTLPPHVADVLKVYRRVSL